MSKRKVAKPVAQVQKKTVPNETDSRKTNDHTHSESRAIESRVPNGSWTLFLKSDLGKATMITVTGAIIATLLAVFLPALINKPSPQTPIVNTYASSPENIDPTNHTFFQWPKYKDGLIMKGGSLIIEASGVFVYSISCQAIDDKPAAVLKVAGEVGERIFRSDGSQKPPITVYISTQKRHYLIAIESFDDDGIHIRTSQDK